jgi:GDPmannose 4,6-dehydratase
MGKVALITGVTGQDGSYLAELLLSKGYEVHGMVRRTSTFNRARIEHLHAFASPDLIRGLVLHYGDITDSSNVLRVVAAVRPREIYHLAAQSHVQISFDVPVYTAEADALGTLRLLDAVKALDLIDMTRVYNAATSELYGGMTGGRAQNERTPFHPRSPYAVAKLYSYWIGVNYREAFGMYVANGILFNHESPRRGENFVTRKVAAGVARIACGGSDRLRLGNLNAVRDWGYAPDYVEGMRRMLQADQPGDYVLASGEGHSVRELVECAFDEVGIVVRWEGQGRAERGLDAVSGRVLVEVAPEYLRPAEVDWLVGDASLARERLGWEPTVRFRELVSIMVQAELARLGGIQTVALPAH